MTMKQTGKKQQVFSTCTLKELCPEDKQKVAKLVKQVVELGQENQRLKEAAEKVSAVADEKVKQIQECNKEAVRENCSLKTKLGQAVTVLRMYHHKVQGLDAALRAMQHAASLPDLSEGQQQQLEQVQQQQQQQVQVQQAHVQVQTDPAEAASAGKATPSQTQQQHVTPASVSSSRAKPPVVLGLPASAAAAKLQQQAEHLSNLVTQYERTKSPGSAAGTERVPPSAAWRNFSTPSPSWSATGSNSQQTALPFQVWPASCSSAAAMGPDMMELQPAAAGVGAAGGSSSTSGVIADDVLPVTPLVLPPDCAVVREALTDLAHWQLQQGLITPGQAADAVHSKVLQFDPSIGSHGAFIINEVPGSSPINSSINSRGPAEHAPAAAGISRPGLPQLALKLPAVVVAAGPGSSVSSGGGVVPGLLDASPWESPTCKQLMDLAAAFDSLAAATPGSAAHASGGSSGSAGAGAGCVIGAASGGAAGAVGVSFDGGVEEVPVEALGAHQLAVVVQNEKSWSSLHSALSPAAPTAMGSGVMGASVMTTAQQQQHADGGNSLEQQASFASSQGQQQQQQPWQYRHLPQQQALHSWQDHRGQQQAGGEGAWQQQQQQQAGLLEEHSSRWQPQQHPHVQQQQAWPLQPQAFVEQQRQQQGQLQGQTLPAQHTWADSRSWTPSSCGWQQELAPAASAGTAAEQQYMAHTAALHPNMYQQAGVLSPPDRCASSADGVHSAAVRMQGRGLPQEQQQQQQQQQQAQYLQQQVLGQEQRQPWTEPQQQQSSVQPLQLQQQHMVMVPSAVKGDTQHAAGSSSSVVLAASDARELLERFDESLVDLLVEVERLEQQQQVCKLQLQQQPHTQLPRQQQQQQPGPWEGSRALPGQLPRLQHDQLARQHMAGQQHQFVKQRPRGLPQPLHGGGSRWQRGVAVDMDEEDVVSDILNHLN